MVDNSSQEEVVQFKVKKVYDPFLRFLHAWNGLSVFSLILTIILNEFFEDTPQSVKVIFIAHVYIGFALTAGILARLIWGFVGPEHAKFKSMLFIKEWINVLKTRKLNTNPSWGHDKYASFAYLMFYVMMFYQVITGLVFSAYYFGMGPLTHFIPKSAAKNPLIHNLKEVHGFIFYASMVYIVIHIGMIFLHEKLEKHPSAQSIFNGLQYRKIKK